MGNKFDNETIEQFMDEYCAQDDDDDLGDFIVYSDDEESLKHKQNHQELDDEHQQELDDDEVEEEVEDEVEEEVEEVEEEEEEPPVGQQEILSLREQLKEEIRRKNAAIAAFAREPNLSSSKNQTTTAIKDGYGTFFGPSKPVLARRVIEEGCSTIMKDLNVTSKKESLSSKMRPGPVQKMQKVKIVSEEKRKVDTLRKNRDYSCLFSDDAETQPPTKDHPESSRGPLLVPKSERTQDAGPVNSARKSKVFTVQSATLSSEDHGLKKGSGSLGKKAPLAERKGAIASGRNGSNLPNLKKKSPGLLSSSKGQELQPSLHNKRLQASTPGQKLRQQGNDRQPPLQGRQQSNGRQPPPLQGRQQGNGRQPPLQGRSLHGQLIGQNRSTVQNGRLKPAQKQIIPSSQNGRLNSAQKQIIPSSKFKASHGVEKRTVKIRKSNDGRQIMHNYDEFAVSDEDESDMEADFASIQREERRSAALARKEDQEQLRLIKEEERRERAMKRKRAPQKE